MSEEEAPKSKSTSNPPPGTTKAFVLKAKSSATLIASVTALVVAITKACQAPEEPGAKAAYTELSDAVKANSEAVGRTHDDIVALRGYVDGFVKAEGLSVTSASPSASSFSVDAGGRTSYITIPTPSATTASSSAVAVLVDPAKLKPLPPVNERPAVFKPQGFEALQSKK